MRSILALFALPVLLTVATVASGPACAQPEEDHVPVPGGWTAVDEEYRYGRENLWEYINGAAELFLTYRFRELIVADFEQGDLALTVSVYDMGRPLDAFGVFESEKPAGIDPLDGVGAAAVLQPPYRGLLLKDRFYVKVEAGGGDVTAEVLRDALRDIADRLPGRETLPEQLTALPESGRVPGSVAFAGANFLGLDDLRSCLHGDYRLADGTEYRLFVMTPSRTFISNRDGRWKMEDRGDELLFQRRIPYSGVVVLLGGNDQLMGVSGFEEAGPAVELLETLRK